MTGARFAGTTMQRQLDHKQRMIKDVTRADKGKIQTREFSVSLCARQLPRVGRRWQAMSTYLGER